MKKLLTILLALTMVLGLGTFAVAADPGNGSITIDAPYDINGDSPKLVWRTLLRPVVTGF